jgi:hypothetical protein
MIRTKGNADKLNGMRRIAFQIPEEGTDACGRSFEDAFMLANRALFGLDDSDDASELEKNAYAKSLEVGKTSKANFALKYAIDEPNWNVPIYIREGLVWLNQNKEVEETSGEADKDE